MTVFYFESAQENQHLSRRVRFVSKVTTASIECLMVTSLNDWFIHKMENILSSSDDVADLIVHTFTFNLIFQEAHIEL